MFLIITFLFDRVFHSSYYYTSFHSSYTSYVFTNIISKMIGLLNIMLDESVFGWNRQFSQINEYIYSLCDKYTLHKMYVTFLSNDAFKIRLTHKFEIDCRFNPKLHHRLSLSALCLYFNTRSSLHHPHSRSKQRNIDWHHHVIYEEQTRKGGKLEIIYLSYYC